MIRQVFHPRTSLLAVAMLSLIAAAVAADDAPDRSVRIVIDYGDGTQKVFTQVPWKAGMTVLDAMQYADKHPRGIEFEHRGRGETAFLTRIDDVKNEGGGAGNRNWLFRVNGERATRGFGALELKPDDVVQWQFTVFNP